MRGPTSLTVQPVTSADAPVLVTVVEYLDAVTSLLECPAAWP